MPVQWDDFISNVSTYIANGSANSGGPGVLKGQDRPGAETNPNFNDKNYVPLVTPSGRRSFGEALAEFYLEAISAAQTPFGATHAQSPTAQIFIKAYGEVFEQIFRNGEPYLIDQKDADGNVIEQGKESLEAYADMSTEVPDPPTETELEAEREKKFCQFIEEEGDRLYSFTYFEFHCIEPGDTQAQVEDMFANRLLQQFETFTTGTQRWSFYEWVSTLGKASYHSFNLSTVDLGSGFEAPYINVHANVKNAITVAGFNWQTFIDNISYKVKTAIEAAHSVSAFTAANTFFNANGSFTTANARDFILSNTFFNPRPSITDNIKKAIFRPAINPIQRPWPFGTDRPEKQLNVKRIQVSYNREEDSTRPILLTDDVVSFFSYRPDVRTSLPPEFSITEPDGQSIVLTKWQKTPEHVEQRYVVDEYENKWVLTPNLDWMGEGDTFADIKPLSGGTLFEFVKWQGIKEELAAANCDAQEQDAEVPFDYSCYEGGKDPWTQLAEATIAYWDSTIVQPFNPTPSAAPALNPAPLGGIYIPIYYGGVQRLAKNLRKAMNMGKTFSVLPSTLPPALAVASALAVTYALHLLEFKLIYLGGIPTPVGPVPMVGFVPVVF